RRAEVQQHAAFQPRDALGEDQKIAVAGLPENGAVAVRMLVNDVVADPDVNGDRHIEANAGGEHADILVRERTVKNGAAERFTHAQARSAAVTNRIVHAAGLMPQPELTGLD